MLQVNLLLIPAQTDEEDFFPGRVKLHSSFRKFREKEIFSSSTVVVIFAIFSGKRKCRFSVCAATP